MKKIRLQTFKNRLVPKHALKPVKKPSSRKEDLGGSSSQELPPSYRMPPREWFHTFMVMNIPIAGWIYLWSKAHSKTDNQLRDFAYAYLYYKLVFLIVSLIILAVLVILGLEVLDRLLAYMEML